MNLKYVIGWSSALCLSAIIAQAQETNEVDKLDQRLKQIQESFEKQQREMRENFERLIREQQAQIESLKQQLATSRPMPWPAAPTNAAPAAAVTPEQFKELNNKVDNVVEAQKKIRPSEFNPSIGLVGETIFSYRSKGSDDTGSDRPGGFDVFQRSVELNVAAAVDPFAKGYAVLNASADAQTGEATMGMEEAALQTTSLPWNLELKAGPVLRRVWQAVLHPRPRTALCESSAGARPIYRRGVPDRWGATELAAAGAALRELDDRASAWGSAATAR